MKRLLPIVVVVGLVLLLVPLAPPQEHTTNHRRKAPFCNRRHHRDRKLPGKQPPNNFNDGAREYETPSHPCDASQQATIPPTSSKLSPRLLFKPGHNGIR